MGGEEGGLALTWPLPSPPVVEPPRKKLLVLSQSKLEPRVPWAATVGCPIANGFR